MGLCLDIGHATRAGVDPARAVKEGFMKALRQVSYKGVCSFEFEKDMQDPLPGLAESMGFFKGTMALI